MKIMVSDDDNDEDSLSSLYEQYRRHSPPIEGSDYDATIIDGSENDEWLTLAMQRRGENNSVSSSGYEFVLPLQMNMNPTRRRAICEFMCPVTVFLNRRLPGGEGGEVSRWDIDRVLAVGVSCVEIPSKWDDSRQLSTTFLLTDMTSSESICLKAPVEWSARIFLLLLAASIGDTFIKNGVASCHLDDETGNDVNRIIRKFLKKTLDEIKELTSEFNSTVYGGSYYLN